MAIFMAVSGTGIMVDLKVEDLVMAVMWLQVMAHARQA